MCVCICVVEEHSVCLFIGKEHCVCMFVCLCVCFGREHYAFTCVYTFGRSTGCVYIGEVTDTIQCYFIK